MADRLPYATHEVHVEAFSGVECDRIVELGIELPVEAGAVEGDDGRATDAGLRHAQIAWMPRASRTEWIHERLWSICEEANERYRFDLTGFEEDLQFTTYRGRGAFYTWHQDGLDAGVAHRKLSLVVQLSDPGEYSGAELELFQVVEDLDDEGLDDFRAGAQARGSVVVFPSFEYHRVTRLRGGTRRSLVAWVSGPPFR